MVRKARIMTANDTDFIAIEGIDEQGVYRDLLFPMEDAFSILCDVLKIYHKIEKCEEGNK